MVDIREDSLAIKYIKTNEYDERKVCLVTS